MGTDIAVFANHSIDFLHEDIEIVASRIKELFDRLNLKNLAEIKEMVRGYYDGPGYSDIRDEWHDKIDNCTENDWNFYIDNDWENYVRIEFFGPFGLHVNFSHNYIELKDPGCRYLGFFSMDKKARTEYRKYYWQIISLFGGNFALYLPDQGDVGWEFTEKIWDYDISMDTVKKGLVEKYGINTIKIDEFPVDENGFADAPYYFMDTFEDIKGIL